MNDVIAYAKLPLHLNLAEVQKEVNLLQVDWKPHFNKHHYLGEWTALSLRAPGGKQSIIPDKTGDETYSDTLLMTSCAAIKDFVSCFKCPIMSVRLLNLKKGASIREHRDAELAFEKGEARLHFPVFTNNKVEFYIEGKALQMTEGECWYINANLPHKVDNKGETNRIHLVLDCIVDDWLRTVFMSSEKTYSKKETGTVKKIIEELRYQNTETSNELANQLEADLNREHD